MSNFSNESFDAYFEIRTELFDRLVGFFPTEMTQPAGDKSVHKISVDTPIFFLGENNFGVACNAYRGFPL